MQKNVFTAAIVFAFISLTIGAAICPAQMVGNYRTVSNNDQTVVNAANFAIDAQNKKMKNDALELVGIERAERQIVAGSNYQMCLTLIENGKTQQATATVYQNPINQFSLTSWVAGKCSDKNARDTADTEENEWGNYAGELQVGKNNSVILYFGKESGDYAAYCFTNNSKVGRAVLKVCKNGGQCEVVGKVDADKPCKVKNLDANLSGSGKIVEVQTVKSLAVKTSTAAKIAPDALVKNLYAAQKTNAGPFFQKKSRVLVDKYFTKDFADLIWKDSVTATDGVGAIDSDPLYNAQDMKITAFVIGKPEYDDNSQMATVLVTFKNFGKSDTVKYLFDRDEKQQWKIADIVYKNGDMLKGRLTADQAK